MRAWHVECGIALLVTEDIGVLKGIFGTNIRVRELTPTGLSKPLPLILVNALHAAVPGALVLELHMLNDGFPAPGPHHRDSMSRVE